MSGEAETAPGAKWDGAIVQAVWMKGEIVHGADPRELRKDRCTAWIKRHDYQNALSNFGWVVDYIRPPSRGGTDELDNLQPMHMENSASKRNGHADCPVRARADKNVRH